MLRSSRRMPLPTSCCQSNLPLSPSTAMARSMSLVGVDGGDEHAVAPNNRCARPTRRADRRVQATFSVLLQWSGRFFSSVEPLKFGPRHCGHSAAWTGITQSRSKTSNEVLFHVVVSDRWMDCSDGCLSKAVVSVGRHPLRGRSLLAVSSVCSTRSPRPSSLPRRRSIVGPGGPTYTRSLDNANGHSGHGDGVLSVGVGEDGRFAFPTILAGDHAEVRPRRLVPRYLLARVHRHAAHDGREGADRAVVALEVRLVAADGGEQAVVLLLIGAGLALEAHQPEAHAHRDHALGPVGVLADVLVAAGDLPRLGEMAAPSANSYSIMPWSKMQPVPGPVRTCRPPMPQARIGCDSLIQLITSTAWTCCSTKWSPESHVKYGQIRN